jgi:hypothetical protein
MRLNIRNIVRRRLIKCCSFVACLHCIGFYEDLV